MTHTGDCRTALCGSPFLRPKRVRKGFFGVFQGDSMHFRGHSRRIAPLLPPFVVYYKYRAVLCSICHSHNSYRAENSPVTANRAVFCFCGCVWCTGSFQRICGAIHAQNRPKRVNCGTLNTDIALQTDRGAGILARQACDQGTGHPRMEPAEKAGSGEITIAIS